MTQLGEATARYHKLLESEPFRDLGWAEALQENIRTSKLTAGSRAISPVLRPHFLSSRQYANLVKAAESLTAAIQRVEAMALESPALLNRIQLLPAEKMLAAIDPGYSFPVASLLDTYVNNGTMRFTEYAEETPAGVMVAEALGDLYWDAGPMKEFRKKYKLTKLGGAKHLLSALLKSYKAFGGKNKKPQIAIVEFRQPFQTADASEFALLAEYFTREGYPTHVVAPEQLEYRNGELRTADGPIDLVFRQVKVQEFLVRYSLTHPLMRAYQDRAVCVVNSFRSEIGQKKAIFDLLTDEEITGKFPAVERHAIADFIPWTRIMAPTKVKYRKRNVDLIETVSAHRDRFVLKPNDDSGDQPVFVGADHDEAGWERALRLAMRTPYVVQETGEVEGEEFPLLHYGSLERRQMKIDVHPHSFLGKVHGASSWLTLKGSNGFSTLNGLAPTFLLDSK
ncbi:MAG: hypothetical protein ABI823_03330 [Bryobacteraceae bacterium]